MSKAKHWEGVYTAKHSTGVSWYSPHLETSERLITKTGLDKAANIIDVGGGASTLVDDLLARGYHNLTVVDLAPSALAVAQQRLGEQAAGKVAWLAGDITTMSLPGKRYDLWHDRAVFHFLTDAADRRAYIRQVCAAVNEDGYVVIATFGPDGPTECSGLPVVRYSGEELHGVFGQSFTLVKSVLETHATPAGKVQQFVYCCFLKKSDC